MDIVVIGLGSMGNRRIRLLQELRAVARIYGVDAKEERRAKFGISYGISTYKSLADCLRNHSPEAAFVCTPPLSHAEIIRECLLNNMHIFSEINLVGGGYEENMALAKRRKRVLFLSSTPLYRKEMQYIIRRMEGVEGRVNYSFHVGQYLSDWHPWDVLQDFFVSRKETNGCRELFAIELPWLFRAFGAVKTIRTMRHKASKLPVAYDDSYFVLLEHETGHHGVLIADVVSREPIRHLEIFGENLFLTWDGMPDSLKEKNLDRSEIVPVQIYAGEDIQQEAAYSRNIVENAYAAEIKNFFAVLDSREKPMHTFAEDLEVLKLIDRIEGIRV